MNGRLSGYALLLLEVEEQQKNDRLHRNAVAARL
jgi:hypothetical protein